MTGEGLLSSAWGAARLQRRALGLWRGPGGLAWGLALLVAVSLLGGAIEAAGWAQTHLQQASLWSERARQVRSLADWLEGTPLPVDAQHELTRNLAAWLDLQSQLEALPRPLGRQASYILSAVGRALAAPYRRLALWLPYSLLVFLLAKALGGRGSLAGMLATTALYALPHALDVLRPLPILGPVAALVALGWGAIIYVRATAVANDLDDARALLAAVLPAMAALTLGMVALSVVLILS